MAHGSNVKLGQTGFRLLHFFMTHPESVHSREQFPDGVREGGQRHRGTHGGRTYPPRAQSAGVQRL
jgi:DNA-binding response OmpR family regulator